MYTITRKPLSFFGLVLSRSIFHVHQNGRRLSTIPTRREALLHIKHEIEFNMAYDDLISGRTQLDIS